MSIYPGEQVWDLTPDGGGEPVQVLVGNAKEACKNDPKRYSLKPPSAEPAPAPEPGADDPPPQEDV